MSFEDTMQNKDRNTQTWLVFRWTDHIVEHSEAELRHDAVDRDDRNREDYENSDMAFDIPTAPTTTRHGVRRSDGASVNAAGDCAEKHKVTGNMDTNHNHDHSHSHNAGNSCHRRLCLRIPAVLPGGGGHRASQSISGCACNSPLVHTRFRSNKDDDDGEPTPLLRQRS